MAVSKCANCRKPVKHPIIDWHQRYAWCKKCWAEYLADYRTIDPDPPKKKPLDISKRRGKLTYMTIILSYARNWWKRHIADDFDRHFPGEPWLF